MMLSCLLKSLSNAVLNNECITSAFASIIRQLGIIVLSIYIASPLFFLILVFSAAEHTFYQHPKMKHTNQSPYSQCGFYSTAGQHTRNNVTDSETSNYPNPIKDHIEQSDDCHESGDNYDQDVDYHEDGEKCHILNRGGGVCGPGVINHMLFRLLNIIESRSKNVIISTGVFAKVSLRYLCELYYLGGNVLV